MEGEPEAQAGSRWRIRRQKGDWRAIWIQLCSETGEEAVCHGGTGLGAQVRAVPRGLLRIGVWATQWCHEEKAPLLTAPWACFRPPPLAWVPALRHGAP